MAVDGAKGGLKARSHCNKKIKLVEVYDLSYFDLVNSDSLLLNGVGLKIVLL